jgi:biopolymer transport protein ExbD
MRIATSRSKREGENRLGVAPVVFLALIFLLMAAMFLAHSFNPIDPAFADEPQASTALVLQADGSVVWRGHRYDLATLSDALARTAAPPAENQMTILADHRAPAPAAIDLISIVRKSGVDGIAVSVF